MSDRVIDAVSSIPVRIRNTKISSAQLNILTESYTELDSHSDTCVVGKHALIIHDYDRPVNVSGFDKSLGSVNDRRIVSAALAYDRLDNGETIMLIINQAIESQLWRTISFVQCR